MQLFWFIPTHGDGRYLGTSRGARAVNLAYAAQIARAADELGFAGVLLPTGRSCEDAWVVASALVPLTAACDSWWRSDRASSRPPPQRA